MKKRQLLTALLALCLALTAAIPGALAYFTTNAQAQGGRTLRFGSNTEITEEFGEWQKRATIAAQPYTEPSFVRARAFSAYALSYNGGANWTAGSDGWYYYSTPVANLGEGVEQPAGTVAATEPLLISITVPGLSNGEEPEDFDVTVVYETVPAQYSEDGALVPNWSNAAVSGAGGGNA